ncbi:MAG: class IV adenylate cyclase [Candidatus Aminicenantes bacterium]|nr:class IV adenylate cyclase [Candidatus Aminicenantes bacterium]
MAENIEVKARLRDPGTFRRKLKTLAPGRTAVLEQEDVYFKMKRGRLKLRIFGPRKGELIHYERADLKSPKKSVYRIYGTDAPLLLREILAAALGIRGIVKKTRRLRQVGQTRVHDDDVEGLGRFVELEVVLRPGQGEEEGRKIAEEWLERLGISKADLVKGGYLDLLEGLGALEGKEG